MSIFSSMRNLSKSAETLSAVALDNADVIPVTADSVRMASRQVSDAAESVKTLADTITGIVIAVAIGWTAGTLIRLVWSMFDDDDQAVMKWHNGSPLGLSKQTLER